MGARTRVKKTPARKKTEAGEIRQDLITGKWVVVAPGRAKRPNDFLAQRRRPRVLPKYKDDCPFCNLSVYPQEPDVLRVPDDPDEWQVHIFPNKYPAFNVKDDLRSWNVGPYRVLESVGYHEILATRWHNHVDGRVTAEQLALQLEALVLRYRQLREKPSVNYIQIIKNHGKEAGASLEHPHHQIFTLPVLPDDIQDLLQGAERAAMRLGQEPFEAMLDFEREDGERIVSENEHFTAFCPFASRAAFEVWIVPRWPEPYFENSGPKQRESLAALLRDVLARLYVGLNDPSYNYYLHSAPCDETGFVCNRAQFARFRWHIAVLPRLGALGGLELSTGLEIVAVSPETAAAYLREQVVDDTHVA